MGTLQDSDYYDRLFTLPGGYYSKAPKNAPWFPLWKEIVRWLPKDRPVVDLGCGPGQFAQVCRAAGIREYVGLDFSVFAIESARRLSLPGCSFFHEDLRDGTWGDRVAWARNPTLVCCEVLEHLQDDLALLGDVPAGHSVIASVPSFDDPSHVRWFGGAEEVRTRYEPYLRGFFRAFGAHFLLQGVRWPRRRSS